MMETLAARPSTKLGFSLRLYFIGGPDAPWTVALLFCGLLLYTARFRSWDDAMSSVTMVLDHHVFLGYPA